jgi:hypothetical protein
MRTKMSGKIYHVGLISLMLIVLADGCAPTKLGPTPLSSTPSETLTASKTVTLTSTFTGTSTPTMTPTLQTTETIMTNTPLSDIQIQENVIDSLKNNGNCQLPCWWGINPGSTSWSDANVTLQRIGLKPSFDNISGAYTLLYSFSGSNHALVLSMDLSVENGLVKTINFHGEGYTNLLAFKKIYANLAPEQILMAYGSPNQVEVTGGPGAGGVYYVISLYYDDLDFAISYAGKAPFTNSNYTNVVFCPTFGATGNLNGGLNLELESGHTALNHEVLSRSLSEIVGMTSQDFYNLYINNKDDACFYTPIVLWEYGPPTATP